MNEKKGYPIVINVTPPSRGLSENYFRTIKYYPYRKYTFLSLNIKRDVVILIIFFVSSFILNDSLMLIFITRL